MLDSGLTLKLLVLKKTLCLTNQTYHYLCFINEANSSSSICLGEVHPYSLPPNGGKGWRGWRGGGGGGVEGVEG